MSQRQLRSSRRARSHSLFCSIRILSLSSSLFLPLASSCADGYPSTTSLAAFSAWLTFVICFLFFGGFATTWLNGSCTATACRWLHKGCAATSCRSWGCTATAWLWSVAKASRAGIRIWSCLIEGGDLTLQEEESNRLAGDTEALLDITASIAASASPFTSDLLPVPLLLDLSTISL